MNFSDDLIRFDLANGALTPVDSFTPFNQDYLNSTDKDTASGGIVLLPDQSTGGHTHLLLQSGKEGRIFLVDRDNMGGVQRHERQYCPGNSARTFYNGL